MDIITKLNNSFNYIGNFVLYGSLYERHIGLSVEPVDMDLILIEWEENIPLPRYHSNYRVEYELMDMETLIDNIYNEPKMLLSYSTLNIEPYFDITKVRSSVSNVCSKAYNKGKKKLIVSTDYDEYLGLKNLYHAMKFPYFAKWKFIDKEHPPEDIAYLNDIRKKIFSTYENSTGTLEERFESVNSWLKPEFNKVMTEFRKNFPKVKE